MKLQINIDTDKFGKKEWLNIAKVILAAVLVVGGLYLKLSYSVYGILLYAILRLIFKPNEKESFLMSFICLIGVASLLAFSLDNLAEQIAVDAYWFLVIGCLGHLLFPLTKQP